MGEAHPGRGGLKMYQMYRVDETICTGCGASVHGCAPLRRFSSWLGGRGSMMRSVSIVAVAPGRIHRAIRAEAAAPSYASSSRRLGPPRSGGSHGAGLRRGRPRPAGRPEVEVLPAASACRLWPPSAACWYGRRTAAGGAGCLAFIPGAGAILPASPLSRCAHWAGLRYTGRAAAITIAGAGLIIAQARRRGGVGQHNSCAAGRLEVQ